MANNWSIASDFKGAVGPLAHRCSHCQATGLKLLRCSGCLGVRYCSRDHQTVDWQKHKPACIRMKRNRARLAQDEHAIRNATEGFMTPANAFETHVGHFWDVINTRDYMRTRFALVGGLITPGTLGSVQEGLEHLRDMLRLCRKDSMKLRDVVPAVMMRLDLDQESYDFVKWWATCYLDRRYNSNDMTLPFLHLRGEDVLEDPSWILGGFPKINALIAVLLVKLKLLVDILNLKITRKILSRSPLPSELWQHIELAVVRSPLSKKLQKEAPKSLLQTELMLLSHIRRLGAAATETNNSFIPTLFEPDESLSTHLEAYAIGSRGEMTTVLQNSYAVFWETEGLLDLLKDARACAARDSENEVEDRMHSEDSNRTARERLKDKNMRLNRIWGYLDHAAQNATYLGPWSERPSERHRKENKETRARAAKEDDEEWSDDEKYTAF
ncbi:hypothetical protein V8C35DRAFT_302552 [Trichoderma chlorosporum]